MGSRYKCVSVPCHRKGKVVNLIDRKADPNIGSDCISSRYCFNISHSATVSCLAGWLAGFRAYRYKVFSFPLSCDAIATGIIAFEIGKEVANKLHPSRS